MKFVTYFRTMIRYWRMANDPRTPKIVRFLIYGGLIYTVSPFDLLPDFIPFLGLLDDAAVLPSVIALAMLLIPKEVKREHDQAERRQNRRQQIEGKVQAVEAEADLATEAEGAPSPRYMA